MNRKELYEQAKSLNLSDLDDLIYDLRLLYRETYLDTYVEVHVFPPNVIPDKIKEETGFHCYWKPVSYEFNLAGRGTHVIVIPKEQYNEELRESLESTYHIHYNE